MARAAPACAASRPTWPQLGYQPGPADGEFGMQTDDALRAFQRDHGLLQDGGTWSRTINALRKVLG